MPPATSSTLLRALYRSLLNEARMMERQQGVFWLFPSDQIPSWGTGHKCDSAVDIYRRLVPHADRSNLSGCTFLCPDRLKKLIKLEFRARVSEKQASQSLSRAFESLRLLRASAHRFHEDCVSTAVTNGILVEVNCVSLGPAPKVPLSTKAPRNVFAYRVRFENLGKRPVGLLGRHLIFQDAINYSLPPAVVPKNSPGVVGLFPIITPGTSFIYSSGTDFASAIGVLNGSYQMAYVNESDYGQIEEGFDAKIAPLVFKDNNTGSTIAKPKPPKPTMTG